MTTHTTQIPLAAFKHHPFLDKFISGDYEPISDLAMPVFAVQMAGQSTKDSLDQLVDFFTEAGERNPMVLVLFITALAAHKDKASFFAYNPKFCAACAKLGKFF